MTEDTHFILLMHPKSKACRDLGPISADIPRLSVANPLAAHLFPSVTSIPALVKYIVVSPEELFRTIHHQSPQQSSLKDLVDPPPPPSDYRMKSKNASEMAAEMKKERDALIPEGDGIVKRVRFSDES